MPKEHYDEIQYNLRNEFAEWCLSQYKINEKSYVTLTVMHPETTNVIYINNDGETKVYELDEKYNQYLIKKYYWYVNDV
jgi:hypothetical protein